MATESTESAYQAAGVDIDAGGEALRRIRETVRTTFTPGVVADVGHFGGLFELPATGGGQVLVASADGVGTKLKLAFVSNKHDTIGQDLVNHCVNDILACGARPLFFLDYFATSQLEPSVLEAVVAGLAAACRENACALLGGETAELPGMYKPGEYDLAGFIVGQVPRDQIVDGRNIEPGHLLFGLPSNGLHTNGYALARAALGLTGPPEVVRSRLVESLPGHGQALEELLLATHRSYLHVIAPALDERLVSGMAHITGGGLVDNVPRMLPAGVTARIDTGSWRVPLIFDAIAERGRVDEREMYRVFNMGIGFVLACAPEQAQRLRDVLPEAMLIGDVVAASGAAPRVDLICLRSAS